MRHFSLLSLAFVALLGAWPASAQGQSATGDPLTLAPGDSIRIQVWRKPELSGDFVVANDGSITHPLYRDVKVAGLPLATVEANVRSYLSKYDQVDPQFVVEPLLRVAVSGEVPRPLVFATQPQTSIANAIARSGGTNQYANRRKVRVIRTERGGAQRVFYVDLEDANDPLVQQPVRSGDQIVVDRKISFVRDRVIPAIGIIGSIASFGLLIDRIARND
jgi:polysaccharide export outer membrane protein